MIKTAQKSVKHNILKPIKRNVFEKKYVKYIENSADKEFFIKSFELKKDVYVLQEFLKNDDIKRLKRLLTAIKKNRKSAINFIPLFFVGIVVIGLLVFFCVFAKPLLERAMENGLEAVFEVEFDAEEA
jgi:hypothetical protein